MGLLKPAINSTAYLKAGILGFEGSGKTYTACGLAIGLAEQLKGKAVAFFDTETGSDFHIERFKKAGIELHVIKSRAFKDLLDVVEEAEKEKYACLIVDSITHVWKELVDSYLRSRKRSFISLPDWGILKRQWGDYSDLFVNSHLHIVMCGRAGYEYDNIENEDTHKMEAVKVGVKMRVESEMAYEPSLLIQMERVTEGQESKGRRKGSTWTHRAIILKDRCDVLNGQVIDNPKFEDFTPIINRLNLGGEHLGVDTTRSSDAMFGNPEKDHRERVIEHDIALETLSNCLTLAGLSGTGKEAVEKRASALIDLFGTSSKTELENKRSTKELWVGIARLKALFPGLEKIDVPAKYAQEQAGKSDVA